MKAIIASSLIALSLIAGVAGAAHAIDGPFGSKAWFDTRTNGG